MVAEDAFQTEEKDTRNAFKIIIGCFMSPGEYGVFGGTTALKTKGLEPLVQALECKLILNFFIISYLYPFLIRLVSYAH